MVPGHVRVMLHLAGSMGRGGVAHERFWSIEGVLYIFVAHSDVLVTSSKD